MKDVLKSITWPGALVVLGVLSLVAYLFSKGATLEAMLAIVVAFLGYQSTQRAQDSQRLTTIEGNTNGANADLRKQIEAARAEMLTLQQRHNEERAADARVMAQLAARMPFGAELPPALTAAPVNPPYTNGAGPVPGQRESVESGA